MEKCAFITLKGPRAVGPYSTAVIYGDTAYISGMGPIDPVTNTVIKGTIEQETHRVLQNIGIVLEEIGCGFSDVLKVTLYLVDMNDFKTVNEIYARYFESDFPARTTIQVARLPLDIRIEIDVIAAYGQKEIS
jgi:2-iminobutanoate/2-iminopropanoate deaminase